jgi:hypothetical protein
VIENFPDTPYPAFVSSYLPPIKIIQRTKITAHER